MLQENLNIFLKATKRLQNKQKEINFFEKINLIFDVNHNFYIHINLQDPKPLLTNNYIKLDNYMRFKLDTRLLKLVLMGPKYANWNNIEIGALLGFERKPDIYRMDVHILINSLHI